MVETPGYADNNHWMYALQIERTIYGKDKEELMQCLTENNIHVRPVWHLNHLQKPYLRSIKYSIKKAIDLYKITLNIPCSISLSIEDIQRILKVLEI